MEMPFQEKMMVGVPMNGVEYEEQALEVRGREHCGSSQRWMVEVCSTMEEEGSYQRESLRRMCNLSFSESIENDIRLQGVFCSSDPEAHAGFTESLSVHVKSIGASLERCE